MLSRKSCRQWLLPTDLAGGEQGFILMTTLLLMMMLVVLGIAATSSTITELQIAANDRDYKRNFFRADSAALEAAQLLENLADKDELRSADTSLTWLTAKTDFTDHNNWQNPTTRPAALNGAATSVRLAASGPVVAGGEGGSSLDDTKPKVYEYRLFGQAEARTGRVIVEMGYKKRF